MNIDINGERVAYATAVRTGSTFQVNLKRETIEGLNIKDRDELKLIISKTGITVPLRRKTRMSTIANKYNDVPDPDKPEDPPAPVVVEEETPSI